jgi:Zn-dependent peptidase ImmA (M78 family)
MIFALAKFYSFLKDFNRRPLTDEDFFAVCEREDITVVFDRMPLLQGFVAKAGERNYIFLDLSLRGAQLAFVAFHELAHFALHEPRPKKTEVTFYSLCRPSKEDDEADAVALVALFPTSVLPLLEREPADADEEFLNSLISRRMMIYRQFGI